MSKIPYGHLLKYTDPEMAEPTRRRLLKLLYRYIYNLEKEGALPCNGQWTLQWVTKPLDGGQMAQAWVLKVEED